MDFKRLETLNVPSWMTLKNLALAAAGAFVLSCLLNVLWGLQCLFHGLVFASLCNLAHAAATAVTAAFFYVFWRKAR